MPADVVLATNLKASCRNLDDLLLKTWMLCEFPFFLYFSTIVLKVSLRLSEHLQTKTSTAFQWSLKTRDCHHPCLRWKTLEEFSHA